MPFVDLLILKGEHAVTFVWKTATWKKESEVNEGRGRTHELFVNL
jgi:hypothetical protein